MCGIGERGRNVTESTYEGSGSVFILRREIRKEWMRKDSRVLRVLCKN